MDEVAVIDTPAAAEASLGPIRSRLLAALTEPGSASTLAGRVGMPRQKVNYHLRELERHGLVELVEERRRGNMTERVMRATARSYVISPSALGGVAPDPARGADRRSAFWMLAVASRLVQDVGTLITRANKAGKPLPTFTLDSELVFASAADRADFVEELGSTIARLIGRYDSPGAGGGRAHRVVLAIHPSITPDGTARHIREAGTPTKGELK